MLQFTIKNVPDDVNFVYATNTYEHHAEESLLNLIINNNLSNIEELNLIVIRTNKQDVLRNSKPCKKCISAMHEFQIKYNVKINNIVYSTENNLTSTSYEELYNDKNPHIPKSLREWYTHN